MLVRLGGLGLPGFPLAYFWGFRRFRAVPAAQEGCWLSLARCKDNGAEQLHLVDQALREYSGEVQG